MTDSPGNVFERMVQAAAAEKLSGDAETQMYSWRRNVENDVVKDGIGRVGEGLVFEYLDLMAEFGVRFAQLVKTNEDLREGFPGVRETEAIMQGVKRRSMSDMEVLFSFLLKDERNGLWNNWGRPRVSGGHVYDLMARRRVVETRVDSQSQNTHLLWVLETSALKGSLAEVVKKQMSVVKGTQSWEMNWRNIHRREASEEGGVLGGQRSKVREKLLEAGYEPKRDMLTLAGVGIELNAIGPEILTSELVVPLESWQSQNSNYRFVWGVGLDSTGERSRYGYWWIDGDQS